MSDSTEVTSSTTNVKQLQCGMDRPSKFTKFRGSVASYSPMRALPSVLASLD